MKGLNRIEGKREQELKIRKKAKRTICIDETKRRTNKHNTIENLTTRRKIQRERERRKG